MSEWPQKILGDKISSQKDVLGLRTPAIIAHLLTKKYMYIHPSSMDRDMLSVVKWLVSQLIAHQNIFIGAFLPLNRSRDLTSI